MNQTFQDGPRLQLLSNRELCWMLIRWQCKSKKFFRIAASSLSPHQDLPVLLLFYAVVNRTVRQFDRAVRHLLPNQSRPVVFKSQLLIRSARVSPKNRKASIFVHSAELRHKVTVSLSAVVTYATLPIVIPVSYLCVKYITYIRYTGRPDIGPQLYSIYML